MKQFTAELITIGAELLKGSVLNTNAKYLGRNLTAMGFEVVSQISCPDSAFSISQKIKQAFQRSDLIILSGGLGPTPDDVTREGVAEYFKVPLVLSKLQFQRIKKIYERHAKVMPELVEKEAMYPKNALPLINKFGIALGFYVVNKNKLMIVLPGVPAEMQKMYQAQVKPLISKQFKHLKSPHPLVVKMTGISEPEVMQKLGKDFFKETFEFGIYPEAGEVSIRIYTRHPALMRRLRNKIKNALSKNIYAFEDVTLSETVGKILIKKRQSLSVAESCTGGLLASELTQIPGASRYFMGGVVAYANDIKERLLDVPRDLLLQKGAVSKETALHLAQAVREKMKTNFGIGVTGVAGPSGGGPQKPLGLVFIAIADARGAMAWEHRFWGNRQQIQVKAVKKALQYLWEKIR